MILSNIKFFEEIHAPTFTICFYKLQGGLHKAVFVFVVSDVQDFGVFARYEHHNKAKKNHLIPRKADTRKN